MRGQITKLSKNRYRIRFSLPRDPSTGKRPRPTKTIHGPRKDAERVLREWIRAYELDEWLPDNRITLNQHITDWVKAMDGELGDRTLAAYIYDLDRFITDTIGRVPIDKVRPFDVQGLFIKLVESGTGPTSVQRLKAALSKVFQEAVLWRRVKSNPIRGLKVPGRDKIKRRPAKSMTVAEATRFLQAASYSPNLTMYEVGLSTGMRPGEYQALSWDCIDWGTGRIRVERAVVRPHKQAPRIGPVKTKASNRSIPVPKNVFLSLREHREEQEADRERYGWENKFNLVFPGERGEIWNASSFTKAFNETQDRANLDGFNSYSLRHTCATLLLAGGVDVKIVSERLGHTNIQRTYNSYAHVLPSMQETASQAIERMLFS